MSKIEHFEVPEGMHCWSCEQNPCICEDGPQLMPKWKPNCVLPFCGGEKILDDFKFFGEMLRSCCKCGRGWVCTQDEWVHGTCPYCGATGNGFGPEELVFSLEIYHNLIDKNNNIKPNFTKSKEELIPTFLLNLYNNNSKSL